jgi:predicted glycoside hydrolase/deacetylase ChbG (UPF0249 family)
MQQLIVTSDDCGLSEGINHATVDLHEKGIVTAASVMANFPATPHALTLFRQYPSLDIGVHLNLTDGIPLTASSDLSPLHRANGHFRSRWSLFTQALNPTPAFLNAVESELAAQIEVLINSGISPRHLTTHLHFHTLPSLRKIVLQHAKKYGVEWVRAFRLRDTIVPFNPFFRAHSPTENRSDHTLDYLAVVLYWKHANLSRLAETLNRLSGTIELVVHPCIEQDDTYPLEIRYSPGERYEEVKVLEKVHPFLSDTFVQKRD